MSPREGSSSAAASISRCTELPRSETELILIAVLSIAASSFSSGNSFLADDLTELDDRRLELLVDLDDLGRALLASVDPRDATDASVPISLLSSSSSRAAGSIVFLRLFWK